MSEPYSLYAKITISPANRQKFLSGKIPPINKYDDWLSWLAGEKMHGTICNQDILNISYSDASIKNFLDFWINSPYSFGYENFDEKTHSWVISLFDCSENYLDFICVLHVLRSVEEYTAVQGDESFVLIYSYLWDQTQPPIFLTIQEGVSKFSDLNNKAYLLQANAHFQMREQDLSVDD